MSHETSTSTSASASDQRIAALEAELKALKAEKPQFLPTGVKPPLPTRLSAKRRSDVPDWIANTRVALQLAGFNLDHSASVAYASTFLDDKANAWWRTCLAAPANPAFQSSGGFGTFDSFAAELQKKLGQPFPEATAREKLAKLQQTRSVLDYSDAFTRIIKDLPERHWKDLRFDYLQGLKLSIREMLTGKISEDTKWEEISSLAHQCDQVLMARPSGARPQYMERDRPLPSRPVNSPTPMELGHLGHVDAPRKGRPQTPHPRANSPLRTASLNRLTDEERESLRRAGACFHCRKPGHFPENAPSMTPPRLAGSPRLGALPQHTEKTEYLGSGRNNPGRRVSVGSLFAAQDTCGTTYYRWYQISSDHPQDQDYPSCPKTFSAFFILGSQGLRYSFFPNCGFFPRYP